MSETTNYHREGTLREIDLLRAKNVAMLAVENAVKSAATPDPASDLARLRAENVRMQEVVAAFLKTTEGRVPADSSDALRIEAVWVHRLQMALDGE